VRLLICGSRYWDDESVIADILAITPADATVIHGAARGADKLADDVAKEFGLTIEAYPVDWSQGKAAGPQRNAEMVAQRCRPGVRPPPRGTSHEGHRRLCRAPEGRSCADR
jgi:hypothetical protein